MTLDIRTLARNFGTHRALAEAQSSNGRNLKDTVAAKAKASAPSSRSLLTLAAYGCMGRRLDNELGGARSPTPPVEKAAHGVEVQETGEQYLHRMREITDRKPICVSQRCCAQKLCCEPKKCEHGCRYRCEATRCNEDSIKS